MPGPLKQLLDETLIKLRAEYVEENKPCMIGDEVKITLGSGRVVKGKANSFGILSDQNVHITSYNDGTSQLKYITTPNKEVEILISKEVE